MDAQETDTATNKLPDVIVTAYEQGRKLKETPAAINYISRSTLNRFDPTSVVNAINSTPGVRMEERSPGSYRFNIRGSSLRSPFGVRNVKVYFNDLPFTDPGGHTYFNQLGYYNFNNIEIIKGPGSSMYGAGTGGVLLIESLGAAEPPSILAEYTTGSFGLKNAYGSLTTGSEQTNNRIGFQHQQSNGYRVHSALERNVLSWNGLFKLDDTKQLKTTFLYSNLFYQTPGALTRAEYEANPKAARPGNAFFPGAQTAGASVRQNMYLAGASYDQQLSSRWSNKSVVYGMFTELRNPNIQNFGRSSEPHFGGRTTFRFNKPLTNGNINFQAGGELQKGFTTVSIFRNNRGTPDTLRTYDEINNRQSLLFTQASLDVKDWIVTAGVSLNFLHVGFERFTPGSVGKQKRSFRNEVAPRLAILKKFDPVNVYASISRGFSPPTTAELLPTGGAINFGLHAEEGWNYDIGTKGTIGDNFTFDVNAFYFRLQNTIVQRRTAAGGDFFENAGETSQKGIESYLSYSLGTATNIRRLLWLSHTFHHFIYKNFKQVNNNFSGNRLPAVARNTVASGLDFFFNGGISASVNYYYGGRIPLNDANTQFADAYHLLGLKAGISNWISGDWMYKLSGGINNLLDEQYSLGNDVNGFGGRFFNAAAARNYFLTLGVQFNYRRK